MKQVAIIGSPEIHKNYQTALEKAGGSAVIFPELSYIEKHPEDFAGLLLPGGGDVLSSLAEYTALLKTSSVDSTGTSDTSPFHGIPSPWHQKPENPAVSADALLTPKQLAALDLFYRMSKPIFGICKGMQLINLYFHGTIREVSNQILHQQPDRDTFHPADNLPGQFLHALFGPDMLINSNHHQCVDLLGQNLQIMQQAPDGAVEAISHLSAPVFGTQWHPERMPKCGRQDAILLFQYFISLL